MNPEENLEKAEFSKEVPPGSVDPLEVERLRRIIQEHKKPPVEFPKTAAQSTEGEESSVMPMDVPEEITKKAPPETLKPGTERRYRYAEGDPVVFDTAMKDKKFLKFLNQYKDIAKLNLENPTANDRVVAVKLYEDFKNIETGS